MRRERLDPRPDWPAAMEAVGFHYHSIEGTYWDESRCYVFEEREIDALEAATAERHEMTLNAAQHVVTTGRWEEFAVPAEWVPAIGLDGSSSSCRTGETITRKTSCGPSPATWIVEVSPRREAWSAGR